MNKWKRYAQQLETRQEERLAESQILKERDEARAEVERLIEALERIAGWEQHDDSYPEPTFHQVQATASAALSPDDSRN